MAAIVKIIKHTKNMISFSELDPSFIKANLSIYNKVIKINKQNK